MKRILVFASIAAILGLGLYVTASRNATAPKDQCRIENTLDALRPFTRGEMAAIAIPQKSQKLPDLAFKGPQGEGLSLAKFKGKTILLNLWATWCAPCRKEMPALDALQRELGSPDFEVVAVNIDTRNLDRPRQWLEENGIRTLAYYADPEAKIFQDLKRIGKAVGMPTTLLISPEGCELAALNGPAEWASADALALVGQALQ